MIKKLLFIILALNCSLGGFSESVVINKIWLEYDVFSNNEKGMKVHVTFNINGLKGKKCNVVAFFEDDKGKYLRDLNGRYSTVSGYVCSEVYFTPGWDKTDYNDLSIFIPYSELHFLEGKRTYYTFVNIFYNGKCLGISDKANFIGWSGSNTNNNSLPSTDEYIYVKNNLDIASVYLYYDTSSKIYRAHAYFHNGVGSGLHYFVFDRYENDCWYYKGTKLDYSYTTCVGEFLCVGKNRSFIRWGDGRNEKVFNIKSNKEELLAFERKINGGSSGGSYVGPGDYNRVNGSSNRNTSNGSNSSLYTKCNSCNGTGICSSCRGKGGKFENTGYYTGSGEQSWINCGSCRGSGKCPICYGRGKL